MLDIKELRTEIAHCSLDYVIRASHYLGAPASELPPQMGLNESLAYASQLNSLSKPYGIDAVQKYKADQRTLTTMLQDGFDDIPFHRFKNRGYVIVTSEGVIDTLSLALAGLLTPCARKELKGAYSHSVTRPIIQKEMATLLGVSTNYVAGAIDKEAKTFLGKYPITQEGKKVYIPAESANAVLQDIHSGVFLFDIATLLHQKFRLRKGFTRLQILKQMKEKNERESSFPYRVNENSFTETPFGSMMSLPVFNQFMQTIVFDQWIKATHYDTSSAAIELDLSSGTNVAQMIKEGKLEARTLEFLPPVIGRKTGMMYFIPPRAVENLNEERTFFTVDDLRPHFERSGVIVSPARVREFLKEKGILGELKGKYHKITADMIDPIIAALRSSRKWSHEYEEFCDSRGLNRETSYDAYEAHYRSQKS